MEHQLYVKEPTRVTEESRTMIDLIATNHLQNIKDSGVITGTSLSDHELSFCVRKINWKKAPLQQKTFRNYANYNPDKFLKDLKNTDFVTTLTIRMLMSFGSPSKISLPT